MILIVVQAGNCGEKPLLVVLRCVPCVAGAGIDASVPEEKEPAPLLDLFVCVRVINANALDLARFQFDYDLSFSAMMFNGDGTVYRRFGSWQHQQDPLNKTTASFKKALDAALVLHRAPAAGVLSVVVRRPAGEVSLNLELPSGWRSWSDISKRAGTWPMLAMAFGGMNMEDLDDAARTRLGLKQEGMALRVKHVGQYGPHAAAKNDGFLPEDILVQVDGLDQRITESALIGHLLQQHRPGEKLSVHVIRGKERLVLKLPQQ